MYLFNLSKLIHKYKVCSLLTSCPSTSFTVYSSLSPRLLPCRDFDASLYLCEEAFGRLPLDTLERLGGTLLLYPYVLTLLLLSAMLAAAAVHNLR